MEGTFHELEIKQLLNKVKAYKKEIGQYVSFKVTVNFDYLVQLNNGKIVFKLNDLKADQTNALTPLNLTNIANRFVATTSTSTTTNAKTTPASTNIGLVGYLKSLFTKV